jgi:hypothetical protein
MNRGWSAPCALRSSKKHKRRIHFNPVMANLMTTGLILEFSVLIQLNLAASRSATQSEDR